MTCVDTKRATTGWRQTIAPTHTCLARRVVVDIGNIRCPDRQLAFAHQFLFQLVADARARLSPSSVNAYWVATTV